jgi:diphthine synthase
VNSHTKHLDFLNYKYDTDIRVKEPTLESLTKKRKEYQPPRFMSVSEAAGQLLEIISRKDVGDHKELGVLQTSFLSCPYK